MRVGGRGQGPVRRSSLRVLDREPHPCFQVRKLLSAEKSRDQSRWEGSPLGVGRKTGVTCNAQSLSYVGGKLFFLQGVGAGRVPWQSSRRQAQLLWTPSLCPQAAWKTWYLGQQPGRTASFARCGPISHPRPSQTPTNYFADLSNTDEGHFNYITHERSPEAMSCLRADGRIAA